MSRPEFGGFRPKSPEELHAQLKGADILVGAEDKSLLTPPSIEASELLEMPLEEIKQKYARRYEMYVQLVREMKHPDAEDGPITLTQEEIEEMKKWLVSLNSVDRYVQNHHEGDGERTLRGKQVNVFEDMRDFLEAGGKNGYIKLPTGFGKTVLFTEFIEALDMKTLIVVPTKLLITQTEEKIKKFASGLETGKIYQKAKEFGRQVTIITYDSLIAQLKNGNLNPDDYDCVILDEVHEALGKASRNAVNKFTKGIKIGFTATPDYSEEKGVKDLLGTEIHHMNIREGVESGHLSSFANVLVRTEADISQVKEKNKDFDEGELEKAVNIESRNQVVIRMYKEKFEGELAVAYCVGVRHAQKLAELFNRVGVSAAAVHGDMSDKEREDILARYDKGEIKVFCNADLLIMGFDQPKASVCFNLRPTKSQVVAEQRGGRVERLDENKPDKFSYIIDLVDKGAQGSGQILFAQVAGGSVILNPFSPSGGGGGKGPRLPPGREINLDELSVISEEEEVMRIQGQLRPPEKKASRTHESALQELEAAYLKWKLVPEVERGRFNIGWLWKNGYNPLYTWGKTHGGFSALVAKASPELQIDFEKLEMIKNRTLESALLELEAAYLKWKLVPEVERGRFNIGWLWKNGYKKIHRWGETHGGFSALIAKASPELQADFEKREYNSDRTPESALLELEAAYQKWKLLPEEERGRFNIGWLLENGYNALYTWGKTHGGLSALAVKASPRLKADFEKREHNSHRTPESALQELEAAYQKWKLLPEEERAKFNTAWLWKNGYRNFYAWTTKINGGLSALITKASPELQADFEKVEKIKNRTPESALQELEAAYQKWKKIFPTTRRNFATQWLLDNGYNGLYQWTVQNGGLNSLVAKASPELQADFTKRVGHL